MAAVLSAEQWSLWLSTSADWTWFECQLSDWHIFKTLVRILVKNVDNEAPVLMMNTVHDIIWELLRARASERKMPVFSFQTSPLLLWLMEIPFGRRPLQKEASLPGTSGENHNSFLSLPPFFCKRLNGFWPEWIDSIKKHTHCQPLLHFSPSCFI